MEKQPKPKLMIDVHHRLPTELISRVEDLARAERRKKSAMLHLLIEEALEARGRKGGKA